MVDHPAIDFFGNPIVIAAVAGLHVIDGDSQPPRDDRGQSAVGVAQNQQPVRPMFEKQRLASLQDLSDLSAESGGPHAHVHIGLAHPQFVEENLAQPVIVVLSGVNQNVLAEFDPEEG